MQQVTVGQAQFEAFVRQFQHLIPSARQPAVETEMIQGCDQRSDPAALRPSRTTRHKASRQPGCRSVKWAVELIIRMRKWSVSLRRLAMAASTSGSTAAAVRTGLALV